MEVVEVKGGVTVLLSEHSGDGGILESIVENSPLVAESDHIFDTLFTFLLERYGDGGLGQGVQCLCIVQTGYHLLVLLWG